MVLLTGLALALSGVLVYLQSQASLQSRVSADLARVADEEIELLAAELDDPGEPFADPVALRAAMERGAPPPGAPSPSSRGTRSNISPARRAVPRRSELVSRPSSP